MHADQQGSARWKSRTAITNAGRLESARSAALSAFAPGKKPARRRSESDTNAVSADDSVEDRQEGHHRAARPGTLIPAEMDRSGTGATRAGPAWPFSSCATSRRVVDATPSSGTTWTTSQDSRAGLRETNPTTPGERKNRSDGAHQGPVVSPAKRSVTPNARIAGQAVEAGTSIPRWTRSAAAAGSRRSFHLPTR